ncbi:MAG: TRAP transporter large permease subunit, partial [Proteobacteria bacterium]|nr:TRAP transporter large permease subunit [Candidatus Fonsibacter sp. PEL4]
MTSVFLFTTLFVFLFMGMPISVCLGLSSMLAIFIFGNDSLASLSLKLFETSEHYTLMAIPFFILGGTLMSTGGVAKRLIRFAVACVGHIKGGLAIASVLACTFFAAVSGSSPATVVAVGTIMIAGMVNAGYPKKFAAGILCNAGTLGILIPPSIVMVVYCAVTEQSVGRMFLAGIVPGLLLSAILMIAIYVYARVTGLPALKKASFKEVVVSAKDAIPGFLLLVIIMG